MIELLISLVIIGILSLLAFPTYLSLRDKAYKATATSNARGLGTAALFYAPDNYKNSPRDPDKAVSTTDNGYQGMTVAELKAAYDKNLPATDYVNNSGTEASGVTTRAPLDASHFCVYSTSGRWFAWQLNATGTIKTTTTAAQVCAS